MIPARPEPLSTVSRQIAGLYAITPDEADTGILERKVRQALSGGARIVQYRNKSADAALKRKQSERLLALCRAAGVPLIVNDDLELAVAIDADGVHLGRGDGGLAEARAKLGARMLLGVSCYDRIELAVSARQQGADYVAFGTAFPSSTKPAAVGAPPALYGEAKMRIDLPIVAIGGLTPDNAHTVIEAGADAIAVISALFDAPDVAAAARKFRRLFQRKNP